MPLTKTSGLASTTPRVGIPWRTSQEELDSNYPKIANYQDAVRRAGGEPVLLSLRDPVSLARALHGLDAFVLPGSPADIDPTEYGAANSGLSQPADLPRETTDRAILKYAFAEQKPVLAICYGCQLLNVYLGGTLIQDLRSETGTTLPHRRKDLTPEPQDDPRHAATLEPGSRLAAIAGTTRAEVNSSHHQAVRTPADQLRVTARAEDGTVEGIEWASDSNWVVGVQWHPERMPGDPFAERLFAEFLTWARSARSVLTQRR
jgi:putative glutamine amidotransferase